MSNTLGIPEVTLLEVVNAATVENTIADEGRVSALDPLVIRLHGHDDDVEAETDDPDKMALFCSKAQGHPWVKEGSSLERVTFEAKDTITACVSNATCIYPFFDYTTYE